MDASAGITFGLLAAAFFFGLRHGIDWDHIVAITDISATQDSKRRGLFVGTMYVLGHAAVVIMLGIGAIAVGATVPAWLDEAAGRIVGVTLVSLGLVVLVTLVIERGSFRARSRWMLLFDMTRRVFRRKSQSVTHTHEHVAAESGHHDGSEVLSDGGSRIAAPTHSHTHEHHGDSDYSNRGAVGIGAIHGIGAETPTQVVVFLAAATAGGITAGLAVLVTFVVGLVIANSAITVASVYGFATASRRPSVQIGLGIFTAVMSIGIGLLFLTGGEGALPVFFAG